METFVIVIPDPDGDIMAEVDSVADALRLVELLALADSDALVVALVLADREIGRASCRERV